MSVDVDYAALAAETEQLTDEEVKALLIPKRVKQKKASRKYAKASRVKAAAKHKRLVEVAKRRGLFAEINAEAARIAKEELEQVNTQKGQA